MYISASDLLSAMNWRSAVKLFDPNKSVPEDQLHSLLEAIRLTPSAYGLQPWKFIHVTTPQVRTELRAAAYDQPKVTDAPHYLVFTYNTQFGETDVAKLVEATATSQGKTSADLAGLSGMIKADILSRSPQDISLWASRQVYIALGVLIASAAAMHIDVGPMEGFDKQKFDEILGLTNSGYSSVVAAAIGYRAEADTWQHLPKVRYPATDVLITK